MNTTQFHRMIEQLAAGDESQVPVARQCLRRIADEGSRPELVALLRGVQAIMHYTPEPQGPVYVINPDPKRRPKTTRATRLLKELGLLPPPPPRPPTV